MYRKFETHSAHTAGCFTDVPKQHEKPFNCGISASVLCDSVCFCVGYDVLLMCVLKAKSRFVFGMHVFKIGVVKCF